MDTFQKEINSTQNFLRSIQLDINMYKRMNQVIRKNTGSSLHVVTSLLVTKE